MLARALLVVALGCHHDSLSHPDIPPAPAATETPVGWIVDGARDLHLTDDQVARLHEIDTGLQAMLAPLDKRLAAAGKPKPKPDEPAATGPRVHAGMRGMGATRGSGAQRRVARGSAAPTGNDAVGKLEAERAADVRDAVLRAFKLLDPDQQKAATQLLSDRGFDLDPEHPSDGPNPVDE